MKNAPEFIYGTAWKEEATADLVKTALSAGFTAIDTANQKKHYREDYVGAALLELYQQGLKRESLFLQSKYTYAEGQDHRLPYNPDDDFAKQVRSSFLNTLKNLHTDYIDSYLLHGPSAYEGMKDTDWEVWEAMEALHRSGHVKMIGVSNVNLSHLQDLVQKAKIKPSMVQNRCFASRGWDKDVRGFCMEHQITYQGFSLLTANTPIFGSKKIQAIAQRTNATLPQVVFKFAKQIGILPLTGTSNSRHMTEDLHLSHFELLPEEITLIESIMLFTH